MFVDLSSLKKILHILNGSICKFSLFVQICLYQPLVTIFYGIKSTGLVVSTVSYRRFSTN